MSVVGSILANGAMLKLFQYLVCSSTCVRETNGRVSDFQSETSKMELKVRSCKNQVGSGTANSKVSLFSGSTDATIFLLEMSEFKL